MSLSRVKAKLSVRRNEGSDRGHEYNVIQGDRLLSLMSRSWLRTPTQGRGWLTASSTAAVLVVVCVCVKRVVDIQLKAMQASARSMTWATKTGSKAAGAPKDRGGGGVDQRCTKKGHIHTCSSEYHGLRHVK